MRLGPVFGLPLLLVAGCHARPLAPLSPVGAVPALVERPAGWACTVQLPVTKPPALLFGEAHRALGTLRLTPAWIDSTGYRITLAGPTAPRGRGTAGQQAATLYLDWRLVASADAPGDTVLFLAPGLSTEPAGLTSEERRGLYRQASALAERFVGASPSAPHVTPVCRDV